MTMASKLLVMRVPRASCPRPAHAESRLRRGSCEPPITWAARRPARLTRSIPRRETRPRRQDLRRAEFHALDRRQQVDDLLRVHDVTGVSRNIDLERGMHFLVRVVSRRVSDHRNAIAKLSGKANGRFKAGMG